MAYLPQILLSLPLVHTGHSYTVTCILRQTVCGWCVSTVLAKSIIVIIAFHLTGPGRKMRSLLISGAAKFIILFCVLIQLTLCGMLLKTTALFIYVKYTQNMATSSLCVRRSHCVLGHLSSLVLEGFTVAFLVRKLLDTINEAKVLAFSMLVFFSVWVPSLPVYYSTKWKVMVAVEVFYISTLGTVLLTYIFSQRCHIIFLKPNKNHYSGIAM